MHQRRLYRSTLLLHCLTGSDKEREELLASVIEYMESKGIKVGTCYDFRDFPFMSAAEGKQLTGEVWEEGQ